MLKESNPEEIIIADDVLLENETEVKEKSIKSVHDLVDFVKKGWRGYKLHIIVTISYCISFIGLGLAIGSLGPTLIELAESTNRNVDDLGAFFTSRGLGYVLGSLSGSLYDKFRGHILIIVGVFGLASMLTLIPFSHSFWSVIPILFFMGMSGGILDAGLNTMIVWIWKDKVNPWMQLLHSSFGIGAWLGPTIIARFLSNGYGLTPQYIALAIPTAVFALPFFFLTSPSSKFPDAFGRIVLSNGDENDTENSLGESHDDLPTTEVPIDKSERRLEIEVIIMVAIFLFAYVGAEVGYGGWIAPYAEKNLNMSPADASYLTSAYWGSFTVFRVLAVPLALVLSPSKMIVFDIVGCMISLAIIIVFIHSSLALWIGTICLGASLASIFPTAISLPHTLGLRTSGGGTGWLVVGASLGEMSIPLIIGELQKSISMFVMPVIMLVVMIVTLVIYTAVFFRVKWFRRYSQVPKAYEFEFPLEELPSSKNVEQI